MHEFHSIISYMSSVLKKSAIKEAISKTVLMALDALRFLIPLIGVPAAFSLFETGNDVFAIIMCKSILLLFWTIGITYADHRLYLHLGGQRSLFSYNDDEHYDTSAHQSQSSDENAKEEAVKHDCILDQARRIWNAAQKKR